MVTAVEKSSSYPWSTIMGIRMEPREEITNEKTTNGTEPLTLGEMSVKTGKQPPATIEASDT